MKIFAHRGAPSVKEENSLEGLVYAADLGVDAAECDVTRLKDGTYIIYHDESLKRLLGLNIATAEIDYKDMKRLHDEAGKCLYTFDEILDGYDRNVPILLHIKMKALTEDFTDRIRATKIPFFFGAVTTDVVKALKQYVPSEKILGFIPSQNDYLSFFEAGAGNIRLWEQWLDDIQPSTVKKSCPSAEVWIMAKTTDGKNEATEERVRRCEALGADGILLDNAADALKWRAGFTKR